MTRGGEGEWITFGLHFLLFVLKYNYISYPSSRSPCSPPSSYPNSYGRCSSCKISIAYPALSQILFYPGDSSPNPYLPGHAQLPLFHSPSLSSS